MDTRDILQQHNIKYTKPRQELLEILELAEVPLTINQIKDQLENIDLSTIYRNLDLFENKGLVNKLHHFELDQPVYDYKRHIHKHHIICIQCGAIEIIQGCPLPDYNDKVEALTGYIVDRHQLELYGICPNCQYLK